MFVNNDSNPVALSISLVKALLKLVGFAPAAAMLEGGQDLYQLLTDISNGSLGNPNAVMIRSLNSAMHAEIDRIEADLKNDGVDRTQVKQTLTTLLDATRSTIKNLSADESKLLEAIRNPDSFADLVKHEAIALPKDSDENTQNFYERLLEVVAAEFMTLTPGSPNFNRVALVDLIRCFPDWRDRIDRLEQSMNNRFDKVDEDNQEIIGLLRKQSSSVGRLFFGSRPDVVAAERFVERDEHKQLKTLIADPTRRRTVLVGMRGCGKTQLASALAQQCEDANWSLVAWVNAVSPESIKSALVELAKELKIDTSDQPAQEQVIERCLNYLRSSEASDRLVIFDNVEDINDLRGLVPTGEGLRVVATTTNNTGWDSQGWVTITVGVFDREKSINYLLNTTNSTDHKAADTLAHRLGDLPLALAQAAATARNGDLSLARYVTRLDSYRSERAIRPVPGDYYKDDVATALCMAIEDALESLADPTRRSARRQLGALALLAESGVPTRWLDPTIEQQDNQELQGANKAGDEDTHDALTELIHRSIIQQSADKATTMLHRLQAQVLRESWNEQDNQVALQSAAELLRSVSINKFRRNATASRRRETLDLIEQLRTIGEQSHSQRLFTLRTTIACLFQAFWHAHDLGLARAALTLQIPANSLENTLALDPDERLTLHICLAQAYQAAGNLPDAIYRYSQVLEVCTHMFGNEDPRTLSCRNYLASAYQAAGNLAEAIYHYEQVLRDSPAILGKYHPNILNTRISLASAYQEAGNVRKAIDRYKQVCKDCIKALGENHPETLRSRINLAYAYQEAGDVDRAISGYEQLLQDCTRILGQDHPHTLATRNNLASAYESARHNTEAIGSYEQLLQDCTRILGQDHPNTLATHNNLANSYALAGDFPKAFEHWLKTYADCRRVLGHHHPLTRAVHGNLGTARRELEQQENDSTSD